MSFEQSLPQLIQGSFSAAAAVWKYAIGPRHGFHTSAATSSRSGGFHLGTVRKTDFQTTATTAEGTKLHL